MCIAQKGWSQMSSNDIWQEINFFKEHYLKNIKTFQYQSAQHKKVEVRCHQMIFGRKLISLSKVTPKNSKKSTLKTE